MGFTKKLAGMTEGFALKYLQCPQAEFPRALAGLDRTLLILPLEFTEADVEQARRVVDYLKGKAVSLLSFARPVEIGVGNIVLVKTDLNLLGWFRRHAVSALSDFTASIDLSRTFDIPISAIPAVAGIGLRIGRDESRAGSIYNVVISGSIEETLKKLMGE